MSEHKRDSAGPVRAGEPQSETWKPAPPSHDTVQAPDNALAAASTEAAPAERAPIELSPGQRLGRFRIEARLGSGGMGTVYRAYDTTLERDVALKLLHAGEEADAAAPRRRVLREARAAAALKHPNVVEVYEIGTADGQAYIAMELVEGNSLDRLLPAARQVPLDSRLGWLLGIARALAAAHERGLVHRDVKPANVLVIHDGGIKMLDFGIAKREGEADAATDEDLGPSSLRTVAGRVVGTPRYMAPEQAAGESVDPRADQYAWGLLACELLTGAYPRAEQAVVRALSDASVPDALAQTIARAMSPAREQRFETMAPVVEALQRSLAERDEKPVAASASSWRVIAVAAGVGIAAAMATSILMSRPAVRPNDMPPGAPDERSTVSAPPPEIPFPATSTSGPPAASATPAGTPTEAASAPPVRTAQQRSGCTCGAGKGGWPPLCRKEDARTECDCYDPGGAVLLASAGPSGRSMHVAPAGLSPSEPQGQACSGYAHISRPPYTVDEFPFLEGKTRSCSVGCADKLRYSGVPGAFCRGVDYKGKETDGKIVCPSP